MEKLEEALTYIIGYTIISTVFLYIILFLINILGITYKKVYDCLKDFKFSLVTPIIFSYSFIFVIAKIYKKNEFYYKFINCTMPSLLELSKSTLGKLIIYIIIVILLNIFLLCSFAISTHISELVYENLREKKYKRKFILTIILLLIIIAAGVYKCVKAFFILIVLLIFFTIINLCINIYKEKRGYKKQNDIKKQLKTIISDEVNGHYINNLSENLSQSEAMDIYNVLKKFHIPELIKLKYILKKDIEERKIKVPIKQTLIFLFSGIGGLITLAGKENTINFISSYKEIITISLSCICFFIVMYLRIIYSSILNQKKTIGTDYLLLLIDNVIELKKEKGKK